MKQAKKKLKVSKKAPTTKVRRKRKSKKAAPPKKEVKRGRPSVIKALNGCFIIQRPKGTTKKKPGKPKGSTKKIQATTPLPKRDPGKAITKDSPIVEPKRSPGRPKGTTKKKPGRPKGSTKKKRSPGRPKGTMKKKPGRPKGTTKKALSRDKYKTANISKNEFVAIKPWCAEHGISTRMVMAKIKKHGLETVKVRGKSTNNQVAVGISLAQAETITKEIQHLEVKKDNEMTLTEIAQALNISERAARSRVQYAKIKGRMGRYSQVEKNPSKRNQPVMLYVADVVAKLKKKDNVISIA